MRPDEQERWRAVEELLDAELEGVTQVADNAPVARAEAPLEARREADRLLGLRARISGFLERPAAELASALILDAPPSDVPAGPPLSHFGPYRIIREAGRGGMATVFLAECDAPDLRQRVAIKVIRDGIPAAGLVERFLRERRILASLDHPGVARLLDAGVTEQGLPWFAMEYVDGVPITRYCDERRYAIDARLELFLRVCDVVQYAHGKLVVHRDLKPSNILVTEPASGEPRGRVKLLDFGIAKLLAPEAGVEATLTRGAMLPLTPEYASPEQLRGESASVASDVYQLGVLLYELLTGRRPHAGSGLPLHEFRRVVLGKAPEPPSSVVSRLPRDGSGMRAGQDTVETVARERATLPERLRRRVAGDLDTICLTALRTEPERRYASVERLADDVRRHLRHEPLHARRDSLLYRWRSFVRRNRVGVAGGILLFTLLAAFAAAMAVQAGRTRQERDRAEQATAYLVDLFGAFEPLEARGATVLVPDLLNRGAARARVELADQPLLRARVLDVIAEGFQLQGLHSDAEPLFEEVVALRAAALGREHIDFARSLVRLADLRYERGRYDAEPLYADALEIFRKALGADSPELVRAQIGLALVLRARGLYPDADSLLRMSLEVARTLPETELDIPIALSFLGKLRMRDGDFDEAERLLSEALTLRLSLLGREHPAVANALDALGELQLARGDAGSAETYFSEALAIRGALYEERHTDVASGLTYLARARLETGDLVATDTLLSKALPIFRRAFGDDSPDVAEVLERMGDTGVALGDLEAADSLYERALDIWRGKDVEPTHDRVATLLVRIGTLRMRQGELRAALPLLRQGLTLRRRALPEGHWKVAEAMSMLGDCLSRLGRFEQAEPLLVQGLADLRRVRGEQDRLTRHGSQLVAAHRERLAESAGEAEGGEFHDPRGSPDWPDPVLFLVSSREES
jgi:serine/threonine-protein kinase